MREGRAEDGEFFADLAQALFLFGIQQCAAADEAFIGVFQQGFLFGVQAQGFAFGVNSLDALKEFFIHNNVAGETGTDGSDFCRQGMKFIPADGREHVVKYGCYIAQGFGGGFKREDGVFKAGFGLVVLDGVDIAPGLLDGGFERGHVMAVLDFGKSRCLIGQAGNGEQGIFGHNCVTPLVGTSKYMDKMNVAPRSKEFDDVYFSAVDGLAETRHVFLAGNGLPGAWAARDRFVIAETGFGTGLNFLAVWKLFEETAQAGQSLEFISFEKYPLTKYEIRGALAAWQDEFPRQFESFLRHYPENRDGIFDAQIDKHVVLRIYFGDVNEEILKVQTPIDCWFLDGFKPASNPEMWTDVVFANMARLSAPGASFATFTAAGAVRRGLAAAGFDVRKVKGFGTKRDMLVGVKI